MPDSATIEPAGSLPQTVDETAATLAAGNYLADRALATSVHLALAMGKPLFLEGEAGVGKTEIAKVLARQLGRRLIRLQCYDGLDAAAAVYDWNYSRQMMAIRLAEARGSGEQAVEEDLYGAQYLIKRPLLQALEPDSGGPPVLLIDELDRADEPFEAFLLEFLSDFQVTIPELGPIGAPQPPIVILTSNRTREVHDALRRRCLYIWVDYPDAERELAILKRRLPGVPGQLSEQIVEFVQSLRKADLFKTPGIAETIDWAQALLQLDATRIDPRILDESVGALLKYQDDIGRIAGDEGHKILEEAKSRVAGRSVAAARGGESLMDG